MVEERRGCGREPGLATSADEGRRTLTEGVDIPHVSQGDRVCTGRLEVDTSLGDVP
jgi:hypothetical protein